MTKEQRKDCEKLAKELMDSMYRLLMDSAYRLEPYKKPLDFDFCFIQGFTAGVESEKKRTQVLVNSLERYFNYLLELKEDLEQYQKGDE